MECVFQGSRSSGAYNHQILRGSGTPPGNDFKCIDFPASLTRCTHTYKQMRFILLACSFFKNLNLLTTFILKSGFWGSLQKSEHLAFLHPSFSIATVSWSCRSRSGVQPWRYNRVTWGTVPKAVVPKPHSRPVKAGTVFNKSSSSQCLLSAYFLQETTLKIELLHKIYLCWGHRPCIKMVKRKQARYRIHWASSELY